MSHVQVHSRLLWNLPKVGCASRACTLRRYSSARHACSLSFDCSSTSFGQLSNINDPTSSVYGVWWGLVIGYAIMTLVMLVFVFRSDWTSLYIKAQARSEKEEGGGGASGGAS
jgi:hypothetical protein